MEFNGLGKTVMETVVMPILLIIFTSIVTIAKVYAKRVVDSIVAKNELISLGNITAIKGNLLTNISTIVQAAVSSNMSLAENLKSGGNKLTDEQVAMLQDSTKQLVYKSLPPALTEDDGAMLKIIGGKEQLDTIINTSLEQSVIDAKAKMALIKK
jgi:hypothetical protein